jgi:hypothetical protein
MRFRLSLVVLGVAGFFSTTADLHAQAGAKPAGWLASAIREEPSPNIVSIKGVGTANAMAEARFTTQDFTAHCKENAQHHPSAAACLKHMQTNFGSKIYRATADCTAGTITTSADMSYTLDGLWDASDIGSGRTRWRDADKNIVARNLFDNGLYISQQWETLCPGPVTPALIARAKGQATAAPASQAAGPAGPRPPSVCAGQSGCDEVASFAARVTDFRTSQYDQSTKVITATVRFVNKTTRPLILGYVSNSAVAINEAGNRYSVPNANGVRGIGEIAGGSFDPKFTLAPGQATDTRFELSWRWDGREIIGQRALNLDLTVREVNEVAPGQYRFGQEHALQFKSLAPGNMTSAAPAGGALAQVPPGATPTAAGTPAPAAPAAPPAQVAANLPDACGGRVGCYDAGPFVAEIVNSVATREQAARPWHTVRLNIRFRNKSTEPIILGYMTGTAVLIDDLGNRYGPMTAGEDAKGIGKVAARSADPQFVLRPGETRNATFGQSRVMRGTQTATVVGSSYTFDMSIGQLEVIYNGQQVRTVREHSLSFPGFSVGATPAAGAGNQAAPASGAEAAENIKKAGDAIRGIFGNKGKK